MDALVPLRPARRAGAHTTCCSAVLQLWLTWRKRWLHGIQAVRAPCSAMGCPAMIESKHDARS